MRGLQFGDRVVAVADGQSGTVVRAPRWHLGREEWSAVVRFDFGPTRTVRSELRLLTAEQDRETRRVAFLVRCAEVLRGNSVLSPPERKVAEDLVAEGAIGDEMDDLALAATLRWHLEP